MEKKILPYGFLQVPDGRRWLLYEPHYTQEGDTFHFTVIDRTLLGTRDSLPIYPAPFHVVIHGAWFIEYGANQEVYVEMSEDAVNEELSAGDLPDLDEVDSDE